MARHVVVGTGGQRDAVAEALARDLDAPLRRLGGAEDAPVGDHPGDDPGLTRLRRTAEDLLDQLDLPAPVIADLVQGCLPDQLGQLLALADLVADGPAGQVVSLVRPGPVAVLEQPARTARALHALVPVIARWDVLVAPRGAGRLLPPGEPVLHAVREVAGRLERLDHALADPATGIHLAPPHGPVGAAESADAVIALALMGRTATSTTGPGGPGARPTNLDRSSRDQSSPELSSPEEPWPEQPSADGGSPRVRREGAGWLLELDLPGLRADDVDLVRHDDDLVLAAAGRTRALTLPSVLRRCEVERAGVRQGRLTVQMRPDEAVWPRG